MATDYFKTTEMLETKIFSIEFDYTTGSTILKKEFDNNLSILEEPITEWISYSYNTGGYTGKNNITDTNLKEFTGNTGSTEDKK